MKDRVISRRDCTLDIGLSWTFTQFEADTGAGRYLDATEAIAYGLVHEVWTR